MKSLKKNYAYNLIYQVVTLISPLITAPYIARVLGASNIGRYSYTQSIVAYIILLSTLGTTLYAQREVAFHQGNVHMQSKVFFELLLLRVILGVFGLAAVACLIIFYKEYRILFLIQSLELVANMICIDWFYAGNEEFKVTMVRNLSVRILNIISIFLFVKTNEDLHKYVLILVLGTLIGNFSLWIQIKKSLTRIPVSCLKVFRHLSGSMSIFAAQIAASVYSMLDKTMIGIITTSSYENGYYEQAQKIERIALTVVLALGTVLMPRISKAHSDKDHRGVEESISRSFNYMWFISLPMMFGIIATAPSFIPWFYGEGYEKTITLLQILSVLLLAIGINNITGIQYLMSIKKERIMTYTEIIGGVVNVSLNLVLIRAYASVGAAIASVIAESIIAITQLIYLRNKLNVKKLLIMSCNYLMCSLVMYFVVKFLYHNYLLEPTLFNTMALVITGISVYIVGLIMLKDAFLISVINTIKNKLIISHNFKS